MMPAMTAGVLANVARISVIPIAATAAGFTDGAVEGSVCKRTFVNAASPAETKKAPPIVWVTVGDVRVVGLKNRWRRGERRETSGEGYMGIE